MKFIHISDVHLGKKPDRAYPWGEHRSEELWDTFARLLAVCKKEETDLLLIAGDLFDQQPTLEELERADEIMCMAKNTEIVLIAGANDYLRKGSVYRDYRWQANMHFLSSEELSSVYLEDLDVTVHGVSYYAATCDAQILEDARPDTEGEIQILLAYGGDEEHMPFQPAIIAEAQFDYVALGSMHKARLWQSHNMAYAGSLEPLGIEEIKKHGYIQGEIKNGICKFSFVPFSMREYIQVKVQLTSDVTQKMLEEKLESVFETQGKQNIYRLNLKGRHCPGKPFDREVLKKLGNVIEIEDRTIPDYDIVGLLEKHKEDIIGMYMEALLKKPSDETIQRALYYGLDALLDQEEPN